MPSSHPNFRSGRPVAGEFAAYAADDIAYVIGDDAHTALVTQRDTVLGQLTPLNDEVVDGVTYAPGKWALKDVVAHLADDERIFGYRLLCVARRDARTLEGFDERDYAEAAAASHRAWIVVLPAVIDEEILAMLFMIIEHFRHPDAKPVYTRFRTHGRLAPDGLRYVSSWVTSDLTRCYQVMECEDRALLDQWIAAWEDIVDFEVHPVITSAEAAARVPSIDAPSAIG